MKKVLIGSSRIKELYPDFKRVVKDIDYAVDIDGIENKDGVEYLFNPIITSKYDEVGGNEMLSLKMSHLFWDINWDKHMFDVQFLLNKGCVFNKELFSKCRTFFEGYLPKVRRSDLEQDKNNFFTNAVNKDTNEHDIYHTVISEVPTYTKILKDGCEVEVCENKFNSLSYEEKCNVVIEEAVVMAYERYNNKLRFYDAYYRQLKDNIQKHYPEFIALFAIENYKHLINIKEQGVQELFKKLNYEYRRV